MFYESPIFWIVVIVVLWIAISPDPLASAIRSKIPFLARKGANAVDTVDARIEAAKAAQHGTVIKGRHSLYELNILLAESEQDITRLDGEIDDDDKAIALARKNEDRPAFDALVIELNNDSEERATALQSHQELLDELKALEVGVDEQRKKERLLEQKGRVMISRDRVADMTIGVNEVQMRTWQRLKRLSIANSQSQRHPRKQPLV